MRGLSNIREPVEIGGEHIALEDEVYKFAFPNDLDQTGRFKLFNVMRQGRGAHIMSFVQDAAGRRLGTGADLLEDLITARLGQSAGNLRKLPVCQ